MKKKDFVRIELKNVEGLLFCGNCQFLIHTHYCDLFKKETAPYRYSKINKQIRCSACLKASEEVDTILLCNTGIFKEYQLKFLHMRYIYNIKDICQCSESTLLEIPYIGNVSLTKLKQYLSRLKRSLQKEKKKK